MKIIFLNTWNGEAREEITKFIKEQSVDTDVFCFQEVYDNMRALCRDILPDYQEVFGYKVVTEEDTFPQGTYVKKGIDILDSGILFEQEFDKGLGVWVRVQENGKDISICNYHGRSRPVEKLDNPERLDASRKMIEFFKGKEGMKVIGGDFNILIPAQSIQMFEDNGYRDLIKDFKIPTTRNRYAWEQYPNSKQYHSDYVFVSPDVNIQEFTVPNNEVSDHLPLIVKIETA